MGVYTSLAKLGTKRWESRGYRGGHVEAGERPPVEQTRFICPECRDFFPYADDCPRCERPVVDRTVALPVAHESPPGVLALPSRGSASVYLLAVAAVDVGLGWVALVEYMEGSRTGPVLAMLGIASAVAMLLPVAYALTARLVGRRAFARERRRAREAMLAMPRLAIRDLPDQAVAPVRVRGRVRVDVDETDVRVRVSDDSGAVLLPANVHVRARLVDGSLQPIAEVRDGDEVELVCRGRRVARPGESYRASASEFELDATEPVDLWVERPRG